MADSSLEEECSICFGIKELTQVCPNKHKCCHECMFKIKICHLCRHTTLTYPPAGDIPYTDLYSPEEIKSNPIIMDFMRKWKNSNFLRIDRDDYRRHFSDNELSLLSSAKENKTYTLYRGIKHNFVQDIPNSTNVEQTMYIDDYPSSWSLNQHTAKTFGKFLFKLIVSCDRVLFDFNVIGNDTEKEVVVIQGQYECTLISPILSTMPTIPTTISIKQSVERSLSVFVPNNKELLLKTLSHGSPYRWTIEDMKQLCSKLNIPYRSSQRKIAYIESIIEHISHTSHSVPLP